MKLDLKKFKILGENFFSGDTAFVARELLGKFLVRIIDGAVSGGMIVETEAYYGEDDPASHAFRGATPRAGIMFGRAGIAYVYFCYGMYYLLNAVTEKEGKPGAVLIRAIEPLFGIENMSRRRKTENKINISNGPGKLTAALGITLKDNGRDFTDADSGLNILDNINNFEISTSERVGISNGRDKFLRFFIKNNPYISYKR